MDFSLLETKFKNFLRVTWPGQTNIFRRTASSVLWFVPTVFHMKFRRLHACLPSLIHLRPSEHLILVMKTFHSVTVTNIRWFVLLWSGTLAGNSTVNMSLSVSWQERPPDSTFVWTFRLTLWEEHSVTCGELWCPGGLSPPIASWIPNLPYTGATVVGPTTGRHPQVPPAERPWSDITVKATTATMYSRRSHPRNSKCCR